MPINVVNIGSSTSVVGGTVTITVGAGGVPAGAHIFVCAGDNAVTNDHSVADTAGNTYLSAASTTSATIEGIIFRERTGLALSNGNTIVYTLSTGATTASVNAFYVTGLANVASEASAVAAGTSTTPSVTSGTPAGGGDLFVGLVASDTTSTFTQDSTNAAWATPPGTVSTTAPVLGGGNVVNTTNSTRKYAPTLGTSGTWVAMIAGFKAQPDVFPVFDVVPQTLAKKVTTGAVIAAIASGLTFVNVVAPTSTPTYFGGDWVGPIFDKQIQYQVQAAPVFTPTAAAVTQFQPSYPDFAPRVTFRAHQQQYLAYVEAAPFAETVTESRWHQAWSEPVRMKPGLAPQQQHFLEWNSSTPPPVVVPTLTGWAQALSEPVRISVLGAFQQQSLAWNTTTPVTASLAADNTEWSSVTFTQITQYQSTAQPVTTPAAAVVPIDQFRWLSQWSEPYTVRNTGGAQYKSFLSKVAFNVETISLDKWFEPLSEPTRRTGLDVSRQQIVAYTGTSPFGEIVTVDKWFNQQLDPVRFKLSLATHQQQFLAYVEAAPFAETVTESRWHQAWSEPVRVKPGLPAGEQQFLAHVPRITETLTVDKWFEWLSEPVRQKLGLPAGEQQSLALVKAAPFGEAITEDKWHQAWSIPPVLAKISLAAADQQFLAFVKTTPFAELVSEDRWHQPWSEPVRVKPGLWSAAQQTLAYYPQLPPVALTTGTMAAKETSDTALFVGNVFTAPVSALVSIIENPFVGAYVGLIEKTGISASVSIIETKGP